MGADDNNGNGDTDATTNNVRTVVKLEPATSSSSKRGDTNSKNKKHRKSEAAVVHQHDHAVVASNESVAATSSGVIHHHDPEVAVAAAEATTKALYARVSVLEDALSSVQERRVNEILSSSTTTTTAVQQVAAAITAHHDEQRDRHDDAGGRGVESVVRSAVDNNPVADAAVNASSLFLQQLRSSDELLAQDNAGRGSGNNRGRGNDGSVSEQGEVKVVTSLAEAHQAREVHPYPGPLRVPIQVEATVAHVRDTVGRTLRRSGEPISLTNCILIDSVHADAPEPVKSQLLDVIYHQQQRALDENDEELQRRYLYLGLWGPRPIPCPIKPGDRIRIKLLKNFTKYKAKLQCQSNWQSIEVVPAPPSQQPRGPSNTNQGAVADRKSVV